MTISNNYHITFLVDNDNSVFLCNLLPPQFLSTTQLLEIQSPGLGLGLGLRQIQSPGLYLRICHI